jgi:3-oxoacyl-[acyl-carrier-protein] synthase-3
VDNAMLARRFGMARAWQQWVEEFIGTRTRYLAIDLDTGARRETLTDLAAQAGSRALAGAGLDPGAVDLVVMGTATPDMVMPTTVSMVAERLGIDGVPAYQLQSGCSGAVQALDVARQMLLAGPYRTALVLGGDVCTRHFDVTTDVGSLPPEELVNVVLFGDGAGAAVLELGAQPGTCVIRLVSARLSGLHRPPGQIVTGPAGSPGSVREDYQAIERLVPELACELSSELLAELGWRDVAYLLPPQLSGRMTTRIMDRLAGTGAREISCVEQTGNNGNALPFLQLERLLPRMVTGDRALGLTVESSKWIKAGFALEMI